MINCIPTFKLKNSSAYSTTNKRIDPYSVLYFNHWYLYVSSTGRVDLDFEAREKLKFVQGITPYYGAWKVTPQHQVILSFEANIYLTHIHYYDKKLLLLQVEETNEFIILIAYSEIQAKTFNSLQDIEAYLGRQGTLASTSGRSTSLSGTTKARKSSWERQEEAEAKELSNILGTKSYSSTSETSPVATTMEKPKPTHRQKTKQTNGTVQTKHSTAETAFNVIAILLLSFVIVICIIAACRAGVSATFWFIVLSVIGFKFITFVFSKDVVGNFSTALIVIYSIFLFILICFAAFGS